jgi:hypothetical protein
MEKLERVPENYLRRLAFYDCLAVLSRCKVSFVI